MLKKETCWKIADQITDEIRQQFPEIHPVILQLMWNRGLRTQEEIDVFLGPDWSRDTHDPLLFKNMSAAVDLVFEILADNGVITIHGDYDADGVCGSALIITVLRDICRTLGFDEKKLTWYIPHREKEGYGMSVKTTELLKEQNTSLIIAVDCGISNKDAIDRAKELGMNTIVCDHHAAPDVLPTSAILIHPLVVGEAYPNKNLCGTGVAFKFACALYKRAIELGAEIKDGYEKWLLDFVAIATVTDVMPLIGENRVLETFGLLVLNKTRRLGLVKLIEISGGKLGELNTTSIGFQIGPRLNAAGRMNNAENALNLLIEENEARAIELAQRLHDTNQERQKLTVQMYEEAKVQVLKQDKSKLLIVCSESWPPGLVGLIAGKLVSEFNLPSYVIGYSEGVYVGSGRSVGLFDVTQTLHCVKDYLIKYGGHPQACGFSIANKQNVDAVVDSLNKFARDQMSEGSLIPCISIEQELELDNIDWKLSDAIECCRPFGQANAEPIFCARGLSFVSYAAVGSDGKHLKFTVRSQTGKTLGGIAFGFGHLAQTLAFGTLVDIAFNIRVNQWNGNRELQMHTVDILSR